MTTSFSRAVLIGGGLGGLLDLLFALSFAGLNGVGPERLLQTIASGWLGDAAYAGGHAAAVLGLVSHFLLAALWASAFAVAARRWPALTARPLLAAVVFGAVVFLTMRLVVLPLSAYPRPVTFKPLATGLDLASHMLLFAAPIVVAARRAVGPRAASILPSLASV